MAYRFQAFPKWKYHATEAARVVADYEAEEALGAGWADRPDLVEVAAAPAEETPAAAEKKTRKRK
jgi:hypothetical protein